VAEEVDVDGIEEVAEAKEIDLLADDNKEEDEDDDEDKDDDDKEYVDVEDDNEEEVHVEEDDDEYVEDGKLSSTAAASSVTSEYHQ
jgi:hypothetical protein